MVAITITNFRIILIQSSRVGQSEALPTIVLKLQTLSSKRVECLSLRSAPVKKPEMMRFVSQHLLRILPRILQLAHLTRVLGLGHF